MLVRVVERVARALATAAGTRRLGVRTRPASENDVVVCAFVWRHRGRAEALGAAIGPTLVDLLAGVPLADAVRERAAAVTSAPLGDAPRLITPRIPVASVTGTNGKTTTTRLLAHICMTAGLTTGWSSTDGVVVQGEMVEPGDYSGPAGARAVLDAPGVEVGILETARGGMLLRGMGVSHNDVSVVTNVSADHLGMQGIDTVDQLAEVKAIVTRVTRPKGWVVLNGEDPRVWAMRAGIRARPWVFTSDPSAPAVREALTAGGRATTVLDDHVTVLRADGTPDRLLRVVDLPMALSGLSHHNVLNALAGASAALGLGIDRDAVVEGLRTFRPDDVLNPGRMNTYSVAVEGGEVTVVVDLAHNEAGPRGPARRVARAHGARRPRAPRARHGRRPHRRHPPGARRDRRRCAPTTSSRPTRTTTCAVAPPTTSRPSCGSGWPGPVWPTSRPTRPSSPASRRASRSPRTATSRRSCATPSGPRSSPGCAPAARWPTTRMPCAARWSGRAASTRPRTRSPGSGRSRTPRSGAARGAGLYAAHAGDARIAFEYAGTHDSAGHEADAVPLYEEALRLGLREPLRHRAQLQLASSLRNLGRHDEALAVVEDVAAPLPRERRGRRVPSPRRRTTPVRPTQALRDLLGTVVATSTDPDVERYRRALTAYADARPLTRR